jgi:hypothetical protein
MPRRVSRMALGSFEPTMTPTFIAGPATSRRSRRPQAALLGGPTALGKEQALNVGGVSEDASFFHGLCTLRPRRHVAGFLQRRHRFGIQVVNIGRLSGSLRHFSGFAC